jgi:hypothetical protein
MKELRVAIDDKGGISVDGQPVESIEAAMELVKVAAGAPAGETMPEDESEAAPEAEDMAEELAAPAPEGEGLPPMPEEGAAPTGAAKEPGCACGKPGCDGSCGMGKSARYAKKAGMRPKEAAGFDDYFAGKPRG